MKNSVSKHTTHKIHKNLTVINVVSKLYWHFPEKHKKSKYLNINSPNYCLHILNIHWFANYVHHLRVSSVLHLMFVLQIQWHTNCKNARKEKKKPTWKALYKLTVSWKTFFELLCKKEFLTSYFPHLNFYCILCCITVILVFSRKTQEK